MINLFNNDCLDVFAAVRDNSISAIVTDPPYGWNFTGADWDKGIPGVGFWKEMLRIVKPGAFLLSFSGAKNHHRLMCAIEDAGWELRDCILWIFSQGFPKSLNISKNIDKKLGKERIVIGNSSGPNNNHYTGERYTQKRKTRFGIVQDQPELTAPSSEEAKKWKGYGTALKPAVEIIIIAMKPIDKNFVNNALKHKVSGLNIDECRIDMERIEKGNFGRNNRNSEDVCKFGFGNYSSEDKEFSSGRWPTNVIFDEEAAKQLDKQSRYLKAGGDVLGNEPSAVAKNCYGKYNSRVAQSGYGDSGGASRFYYCAKTSPSERREYNNHLCVKPLALIEYLVKLVTYPDDNLILDPFMGSGTTGIVCKKLGVPFIGIEKEKDSFEIAKKRINDPWFYQTKKEKEKQKKKKQDESSTNILKIF